MEIGRPIFSTGRERVGFCRLPADGSFDLAKRVAGLAGVVLGKAVGVEGLQGRVGELEG